ncbi:MAG: hypothetical protein ACI3XL_05915, partial [Eubacteriales bacterium]
LTLDNGKTATVNLEVENNSENLSGNTWKIEALSDLSSKCEYTDGKLNILIFEGLEFYYCDESCVPYVKPGKDIQDDDDIWNYLNIIVVINGEQYKPEIFKKEIDNYKYYASVKDLSEKPYSYTIIYEIGPAQSVFCDRFAVTVQNQ